MPRHTPKPESFPRDEQSVLRWIALGLALTVVYIVSSGPVLGLAFCLREATGWNGFYSVMWLYYPILALGHGNPLDAYIDWWVVDVCRTVGPG